MERLQDLQRILDIDVFRATAKQIESEFVVDALVSEVDMEHLRREGYELEIIKDADELDKQRRMVDELG